MGKVVVGKWRQLCSNINKKVKNKVFKIYIWIPVLFQICVLETLLLSQWLILKIS